MTPPRYMRSHFSLFARFTFACLYFTSLSLAGEQEIEADKKASPSILGTWQNITDPFDLRVYETGRLYQSNKNGELLVLPVSQYEAGRIIIPDLGPAMRGGIVMKYTLHQDLLTLTQGALIMDGSLKRVPQITLKRVPDDKANISLKASPIGPLKKAPRLDKATAERLNQNLITRMQRDQASRSSGNYGKEAVEAQTDDYLWLKETIAKHGWIDAKRFSPQAAQAAFLIAQHCLDMRLRLAAQEGIKKDMESGSPVHGIHAWLYDRNRLYCRGNQRYGTHYRQLPSGDIEILPLESARQIDSWRRKARQSSWESHQKSLSQLVPKKRVIIAPSL